MRKLLHLETLTIMNPDEVVVIDDEDPEVLKAIYAVMGAAAELSSYGGPVDVSDVDLSRDDDDDPLL